MIPFGNQTVTMLHRTGTGYERHVLTGCSWKSRVERGIYNNESTLSEHTTCRIPPKYPKPEPGDLMILGEAEAEARNEIELGRLADRLRGSGYSLFRVQACADNRHGPLAHYAATGA